MFRRHFLEDANGATTASGAGAASAGTSGGTTAAAGAAGAAAAPNPSITDPATAAAGSGAGAGGGANAGAGAAGGGTSSAWMDSLPDEIKRDPSLQLFKESGVSGLAKSWVSSQQLIGKDKVLIPGEQATAEEWATLHAKLGRPEDPSKYELKLPDGQKLDEKFAGGFKETAFKAGLSGKQVQQMAEWYAKEAGAAVEGKQAASAAELTQALDTYRTALGGQEKFMARVDVARQAVRALGDEKLTNFLKESGAGSRPEMIEFFAKLAGMMSEDKLRDGTGVPFGGDPADVEKEISAKESAFYSRFEGMTAFDRRAASEDILKLRERLEAMRAPRQ